MCLKNFLFIKLVFLFSLLINQISFAENHDINEILKLIQKDIKTLEKAVYSNSIESNGGAYNTLNQENNSEDVLTRHLLKLSEIENQFQELTNRFEEINFKLDKLSNRISKVQADNQIRFQDIENVISTDEVLKKTSSNKK